METSSRNMTDPSASFIDGSVIFWLLKWPEHCTAESIGHEVYEYVREFLFYQDVYLIFDQYKDFSIKSTTRTSRAKNIAYRYKID